MNTKLFEKANEMIRTFEYASLGVIDESGYPSASAIILCNLSLWRNAGVFTVRNLWLRIFNVK